jgi:uncharacterized iron-regulated membrane protein
VSGWPVSRARRTIVAIHLALALAGGVLLSVVTVTGSVCVFRPEIDRWSIDRGAITEGRADLDRVAADLRDRHPGARVAALATSIATGSFDEWNVRTGAVGATEAQAWKAFTDPGSGRWLGDTRGSRIAAATAWIAAFHHHLWIRPVGLWLVWASGVILVVFVATGLILWWPGLRGFGTCLAVRWRSGWHARTHDLHRLAGLIASPVFLVVAVTGAMNSFPWMKTAVHSALGGTARDLPIGLRPVLDRPVSTAAPGEIGWSQAVAAAEAAIPGLRAILAMPPRDTDGTWRVVIAHAGDISPKDGIVVSIDRHCGEVRGIDDPRTMSAGGWFLNQYWGLHIGWWGGPATRIAWVAVGLLPPLLLSSGIAFWLLRRRAQRLTGPVSDRATTAPAAGLATP